MRTQDAAFPPPAPTDAHLPDRGRPGRPVRGPVACHGNRPGTAPREGTQPPARNARRSRGLTSALLALAVGATTGACTAPAQTDAVPGVRGSTVRFAVAGSQVDVDTRTLRMTATADGRTVPVSGGAASHLGTPGKVRVDGSRAEWSYPATGLEVTAAVEHGRVRMTVHSAADQTLQWPVTGGNGAADQAATLQVPRGEGLSVPVADPFWNSPAAGLAGSEADLETGALTLPVWGYTAAGHSVSYLVPDSTGTSLAFASSHSRLRATARHAFSRRENTRDYTLTFAVTKASPVAPGTDYRRWLDEHGGVRTLAQKIAATPATRRLLGAEHAYLWGGALQPDAVRGLRQQGATRLWLGYDADGHPMSRAAVHEAHRDGYLVGPYDSYDNGQPADSADTPVAKWPGTIYPDFCIRTADGKLRAGFGGRGCYLSSQAFAQAEAAHHFLARHTADMTANGVDSLFLDVDAAGELFSDHSAAHPMNRRQDRANRLKRLHALAADRLVVGSESAVGWSVPDLSFTHGAQTPVTDDLWTTENDRKLWGGYWPQNAPAFFFKPVTLPRAQATAMFDPAYRVPIYQTALHDVLVSTDRWELPYNKLPDQKRDRALLSLLYDTPLNFTLSDTNLATTGKEMAALQKDFAPLHQAAATAPMTSFRQLTDDHRVQHTEFGHGTLTVTANFSTTAYHGLPGGCADARLHGEATPRRICPVHG
ncbi:glycoside hydrolase [Streptomyces sp. NPDC059740]|uniref:glycoside hydrolase n=1 Tax=Streptomyces sp. NPDC059740 TaxID=3346926 RepID=UPI00365F14CA